MAGGSVENLPCFRDLIAVLFECILIISLGYLSARFKLTSTQAKDLNSYLTTFALPMIIFLNIVQMEFQTINLSFLFCMLSAKLLVFTLVTLLTITITYPTNFGYAGSLSILATQSNDFALGYPLIKSLYGDTKQEMLNYLSLMAPIQLIILNPLGIVMLEYHKSKTFEQQQCAKDPPLSSTEMPACHLCKLASFRTSSSSSSSSSSSTSPSNEPQQPQITSTHHNQRGHFLARQQCAGSTAMTLSSSAADSQQQQQQQQVGSSDEHVSVDRPINGLASKNVKSLALCMPARNIVIESGSEESIHSLSGDFLSTENKLSVLDDAIPTNRSHQNKRLTNKRPHQHGQQQQQQRRLPIKARDQVQLVAADRSLVRRAQLEKSQLNSRDSRERSESPTFYCNCQAGKRAAANVADSNNNAPSHSSNNSRGSVSNLSFLKALATNPLIIASVVALMVNLIHGPELPKFVTRVSNTIAASFAAPALFVVGLSMYGKFELLLRNPNDLLLSSVLVLSKVLLLPTLMRTLALLILPKYTPLEETPYLIDFSFLYGLLPTAPGACIIANQYGVLSNVVSISMLLSTVTSAPLMLVASLIINPSNIVKPSHLDSIVSQTMKISSVLTLALASLTLYAFWKSNKRLKYTNFVNNLEVGASHCRRTIGKKIKTTSPAQIFLLLLILSQVVIGFGGLIYYFVDTSKLEPLVAPTMELPFFSSSSSSSSSATSAVGVPVVPTNENNDSLLIDNQELVAPAQPVLAANLTSEIGANLLQLPQPVRQDAAIPPMESPFEPLPSPEPLQDSVESFSAAQNLDFGSRTLIRFQYVLAASGLLMARFIILCIIITIASIKFRGHPFAARISSLLLRLCVALAGILTIWLIFDSDPLKYSPTEPSIPEHSGSLYVHLIYNTIFLFVAIPVFALIIRGDNKDKVLAQKLRRHHRRRQSQGNLENSTDGTEIGSSFAAKRFVTSTVSLTSDASSALTSNTNIESASTGGQQTLIAADINETTIVSNNNNQRPQINPTNAPDLYQSVVPDCRNFEFRPASPAEAQTIGPHISTLAQYGTTQTPTNTGLLTDSGAQFVEQHPRRKSRQEESADELPVVAGANHGAGGGPPEHNNNNHYHLHMTEFDKYSVVIVFMLINSALNMMSVAQKLLHDQAFGTYRQIEVINVGLEFGQGLLTFLIYGTKGLLNR